MNRVVLVGYMAREPELKYNKDNVAIMQFTISVRRQFGDKKYDYISCVASRQQAEYIKQYIHERSLLAVDGRIQTRSYDDAGGVKRYVTEVICEQVQSLNSNPNGGYSNVNAYNDIIPPVKSSSSISNGDDQLSGNEQKDDNYNSLADILKNTDYSEDDLL